MLDFHAPLSTGALPLPCRCVTTGVLPVVMPMSGRAVWLLAADMQGTLDASIHVFFTSKPPCPAC